MYYNTSKLLFKKITFLFINLLPITLLSQSNNISWTQDTTIGGVHFYHAIENRDGKNIVFLRMNNTNKYHVEIIWKEMFTTQAGSQIEGKKSPKKLIVKPGEISDTNYLNPSYKQLIVLPEQVSPTYVAEISKYSYESIIVTKIK